MGRALFEGRVELVEFVWVLVYTCFDAVGGGAVGCGFKEETVRLIAGEFAGRVVASGWTAWFGGSSCGAYTGEGFAQRGE